MIMIHRALAWDEARYRPQSVRHLTQAEFTSELKKVVDHLDHLANACK